ncbi:MAG: cytochrome P450 [Pseudomonadota bacterium]
MALPELAPAELEAVADAPLTAPVIGGYSAVSWLQAQARLGPVFSTTALGEPCVVVTGSEANRTLWRSPDDWSYRDTDAGTFFCRQMGEDHVSALDGEPHRRLRKLILPAFGIGAMQRDLATAVTVLDQGVRRAVEEGSQSRDLYGFLTRLLARVLTRTQVKSAPADALLERLCAFEEDFIFGQQIPLPDQDRWFARPEYLALKRDAFDYFRSVATARAEGERAEDSLQLLLDRPPPAGAPPLTPSEQAEAVYLLSVAGVGNIANLVCPLVYSLQDTQWPQRLREELEAADLADPEVLRSLSVLPALQRETERLFAPAPIIPKRATRDVELLGQPVDAGALVMHLHTLWQFDPQHFDAPLEFRPERWLADAPIKPNAFGGGKHLCLGMGVTRVLLPLVVAALYRYAEPRALETPVQVPLDPAFTPSPVTTRMVTRLDTRR